MFFRHVRTFQCLQTVSDGQPHPPENSFTTLLLDDEGGRLVAAGSYMSVWGVDTPATKAAQAAEAGPEDLAGLHESKVVCCLFSAQFAQSVTVDDEGGVVVHDFDPATGRLARSCTFSVASGHGETATITDATFDGNGSRLITSATDGSIRIWNVNSGEMMPLPQPLPAGAPGAPAPGSLEAAEAMGMSLKPKPPVADASALVGPPIKPVEVTGLVWLPGSTQASVHHLAAVGWAGAISIYGDTSIWRYGMPTLIALPPPSARVAAASGAQAGRAADVLCVACCAKQFVAVGTADGRLLMFHFRSPDLRLSPTPKTVTQVRAVVHVAHVDCRPA